MFNVLKRELAELSEKRNRRSKIESMLGSLCSEERDLSQKEYTLRISLSKENADVERLEKTTATSVFYSILGKKDERLEREQQEAYAVKLKYDAAVRQMDDCRTRIEALEQEQRTLLQLLQVKNVEMLGSHAKIRGKLGNYSVHMGSAVTHMEGKGSLVILPVHSQTRGRIFLPFADEDPKTAEVMSKILLLAEDGKIKDPAILAQIGTR